MKTTIYLGQVIKNERRIQRALSEIDRYREMATSITVQSKEDKIQTSSDKDRMGSAVSHIVDLEREVRRLDAIRVKIIDQIEDIDDADMCEVLYGKYIRDENLMDICDIIHCKKTKIYDLYNEAIKVFEEKYGETYL